MKRATILIILFTTLCVAESKKISWERIKISIDIEQKKIVEGDDVIITLWAYNPYSFAVPFRYKSFIKVNNIIFLTKKSKISTRKTLPPRKKILLGKYKQKNVNEGIYKISGFVKLKTKTLKSPKKTLRGVRRKIQVVDNRNSDLAQRLDQRRDDRDDSPRYRYYYHYYCR